MSPACCFALSSVTPVSSVSVAVLGACGVALIFSGVPCTVSEYRIGVGLGGEIALASGFVWVIDRAVLLGPKSSFC